jgi:dolichol-phosphate mannosyltransferase
MGEIAGSEEARRAEPALRPEQEGWRAEPALRPASETLVLTVIVPVYNEVGTIDELLRRVLAAPYNKQVIVVDDGSTDGTVELLEKWEGHPQVELLQHSKNRGKGAAIRTGLEHAEGRFTIIQDGDLEYDPEDFPRLIGPLLSGEAQVVYGSRYLRREGGPCQHWRLLRFGVSCLNVCVRLLYGARLTDEATCYKAFPTALLRAMELECERFEFCPEVTAKACRLGLTIREVPISYDARGVQAGKKIRFRDGLAAMAALWRWRRWQGVPGAGGRTSTRRGQPGRHVLLRITTRPGH